MRPAGSASPSSSGCCVTWGSARTTDEAVRLFGQIGRIVLDPTVADRQVAEGNLPTGRSGDASRGRGADRGLGPSRGRPPVRLPGRLLGWQEALATHQGVS